MAQGIDDQDRDAEDLRNDCGRNVMAIAEVGREFASGAGKDVAVNEHFAVRNFGGDDFHAADFEWGRDFVGFGTDVIAESMLSVECVVKDASQVGHGMRRGVDGHGTVGQFTKPAEVVKPRDMVGMRMGEDGGVDPAEAVSQGLGPEIGSGIDEKSDVLSLDEDGLTQAFVA